MTIADMPRRYPTTTEEMARSLERIVCELETLNVTLDRLARALGAGSREKEAETTTNGIG